MRLVAALGVFGLLVGAYLLGAHHAGTTAAPPVVRPAPGVIMPGPVSPSTDPQQSAVAWLRGYRGISYTDPAPWAWAGRVLPVVTGQLAAEYLADQGASGGAEWSDYVAQRCATSITAPVVVIPSEAPRSDSEVYAEVTGEALTRCAVGAPPAGPTEQVSATLELLRGPDRYWRVTRRVD